MPGKLRFSGLKRGKFISQSNAQANVVLQLKLNESLDKLAELTRLERDHQLMLESLYLHQEELQVQNDELRHAQISLENARRRHQELFDFSPVAQFLVSPNGMILKTNRVAGSLLELGSNDLHNYHFPNLARSSSDRVNILNFLLEVSDNKQPQPIDVDLFRRDGKSVHVQLHGSRSGAQQETSILLTAVDNHHSTELAQERLRLKQSESLIAALLSFCRHPAIIINLDGLLDRANPAFTDLTGYGGNDLTRLHLSMLCEAIMPMDWQGWISSRSAAAWHGEVRIHCKTGECCTAQLSMKSLLDERNCVLAYLGQFGLVDSIN